MAAISDAVVIGIVLGLVFAAVGYYLYTLVSQLERKVSLMENILLDLKVTTEQTLMSVTEAEQAPRPTYSAPFEPSATEETTEESRNLVVDGGSPRKPSNNVSVEREKTTVSVNYESMTYKELVQLARQKGISGVRTMSKAQVIDTLRRHDSGDAEEDTPFVEEEGTNITDLMSAQPSQGSALEESEVDGSLVQ